MGLVATSNCVLMCDPPTASVSSSSFITGNARLSGGDVVLQVIISALSGRGNSGTITATTPATIVGSSKKVTSNKQPLALEGDSVQVATVEIVDPTTGATAPSVVTVKIQSAGQTSVKAI